MFRGVQYFRIELFVWISSVLNRNLLCSRDLFSSYMLVFGGCNLQKKKYKKYLLRSDHQDQKLRCAVVDGDFLQIHHEVMWRRDFFQTNPR